MKPSYPFTELVTNRLILRKTKFLDASTLWKTIYRKPSYHQLYNQETYESIHALQRELLVDEFKYINGSLYKWVFTKKEKPKVPMGIIELGPDDINDLCWIAWIIGKPFARNGYTLEAAEAVLEFAFESAGFHRVETVIAVENIASIKLAEHLGMVREGHRKESWWTQKGYLDQWHYGIVKEDYLKKFENSQSSVTFK